MWFKLFVYLRFPISPSLSGWICGGAGDIGRPYYANPGRGVLSGLVRPAHGRN